jgi:hypothetical protein
MRREILLAVAELMPRDLTVTGFEARDTDQGKPEFYLPL